MNTASKTRHVFILFLADIVWGIAFVAQSKGGDAVGAFSFNKNNQELKEAVNQQLSIYLGSDDHRNRMSKYGIMNSEIDSVVTEKTNS